jgi:hypothetical protein
MGAAWANFLKAAAALVLARKRSLRPSPSAQSRRGPVDLLHPAGVGGLVELDPARFESVESASISVEPDGRANLAPSEFPIL